MIAVFQKTLENLFWNFKLWKKNFKFDVSNAKLDIRGLSVFWCRLGYFGKGWAVR